MKRLLLTLLLSCSCLFLFAQKNADSLRTLIDRAPDDTSKVWLYGEFITASTEDSSGTPFKYFQQGLALAQKLAFSRGEADLLNVMGNYCKLNSRVEEALEYYKQSLAVNNRIGDKNGQAVNNSNIGNVYNNQGMYTEALKHYINALRLFEELNNIRRASSVMISIGNVHADQNRPDLALKYYLSSLKVKEQLNDKKGIASNLLNIGAVYYDMKNYPEALRYFLRSLALSKEIGFSRGVFVSFNNISEIHYKRKDFKRALDYQLQSLELRQQGGDKTDIAQEMTQVAHSYLALGNHEKATDYFNQALAMAKEVHAMEVIASAYQGIAEVHGQKGDHKKAYDSLQVFMTYKDSLLNKDVARQVSELETKYQTEKKDLEISKKTLELENSNLELSRKRTQLYALLAGAALVLALAYLFYNRHRAKQKQLFDAEVLRQQELRNKAIIEAEEKERIRIAKDLHDGVGQQLSAVKMNLSAYESSLPPQDETQKDKLQALMHLIDESVREVRSVSHNMMPNALMRSGLATAVREFVNKISSTDALRIDLQIVGLNERLEPTTETVLYRVLQECVSNIIRHAQASEVHIQLIKHADFLNLMLEDNGIGFDTSKLNDFSGIGLKNIISRIQYLNGTVDFDSTPGKGTTVIINIPLS